MVAELGEGADEDNLLNVQANRAVLDILLKTNCRVREFSLPLISGEQEYQTDEDMLRILELWNSASNRLMEPFSLGDMNARRRAGSSSAPARYYSLQGSDMLLVWPTPGTGENLMGQYVPKPDPMTSDSDDPQMTTFGGIPHEYHDVIELYMLHKAARADDHQQSQRGQQYLADYFRRLNEMKNEILRKRGKRKPGFHVKRSRSTFSRDRSATTPWL